MPLINYRLKNGKRVKGVTSILNVMARPALIYWSWQQGLANYNKITEQISKILSDCETSYGYENWVGALVKEQIQNFQIPNLYEQRDRAATAGTLAHLFVENHLRGLPDPSTEKIPEDIIKKAEGSYLAYCEWEKNHKFKMIHSELSLVSEVYGFGGTLDIGAILGDMGIVDIKTSKAIYPVSMLPQIAAYGYLYNEHYPENKIQGYHIIRLGEEGDFEHRYWPSLDDEWEIFLACLKIQNILDKRGWKL